MNESPQGNRGAPVIHFRADQSGPFPLGQASGVLEGPPGQASGKWGVRGRAVVEWVGSRACRPLLAKLFLAAGTFVVLHMWWRTSPRELP